MSIPRALRHGLLRAVKRAAVILEPDSDTRNQIQATDIGYRGLSILLPTSGTPGLSDPVFQVLDGSDVMLGVTHGTTLGQDAQVDVGGALRVKNTPVGSIGSLQLFEGSGGVNYWTLKSAASLSGNHTLTLPDDQGAAREVARLSDGSGTLTFGPTIPTNSGAPSSPQEGDIYYDTGDDELYFYDGTRAHWLSVFAYTYNWGWNGSPASGTHLRWEGGHVQGTNGGTLRGPILPWDAVLTRVVSSFVNSATVDVLVRDAGSTAHTHTVTSAVSLNEGGLDVDLTGGNRISCRWDITSGSPTNPAIEYVMRRKKS